MALGMGSGRLLDSRGAVLSGCVPIKDAGMQNLGQSWVSFYIFTGT